MKWRGEYKWEIGLASPLGEVGGAVYLSNFVRVI
jgi:hypothetical protein